MPWITEKMQEMKRMVEYFEGNEGNEPTMGKHLGILDFTWGGLNLVKEG